MNLKQNNSWFDHGKQTTVFLFLANVLVRFTIAHPIHEVHTKDIAPSQSSPPQFTIEPLDGNQNPETVLPSPRDPLRSFGRFRHGSIGKFQDWTLEPKTTASSDWSRGQARRPPLKSGGASDLSRTWIWEESQIEDNLIDKSDPFTL